MSSSMLKLNPEKNRGHIWVSCSAKEIRFPVRIFGKLLRASAVVNNLGIRFDANFSFANHDCNICKACLIQMRDLRWVRQYLMDHAAVLAANALVSSRLDYCNSLFRSLSSFHMCKLQCIQNTLGRIVTNCNRYSWASSILKKLHWLQVEFRCIFKTATLVYSFLTVVTQTISALICLFIAERMSQDTTAKIRGSWRFLILPICTQIKKHFGHSFAFNAPTPWNELPDDVRSAPTLTCFRKKLRSYLFDKAFPP